VIFLAAAVAVLAIAVWMMFFIPKPACGILALLGGALAFAAMLHASRRNHGD
jgi:hypothetical protein